MLLKSAQVAPRLRVADITRPTFPARNPTIKFIGRGEAATRIVTFAQVWPRGWLPSGTSVCLRTSVATANGTASGTQIRTQTDIHHTWADGSAAITLHAAEVPRLNAGEMLTSALEIGATHPTPGSNLSWATVVSGKAVSVAQTPLGESTTTTDVLANLQADYWRQGPLVVERRCEVDSFSAPMKNSTRLTVDVAIDANGVVTVDPCPMNDVVLAGGDSGTWKGTITVSVNGTTKLNTGDIYHNLNKRLVRQVSSATTKPPAAIPDFTVVRDAGVFPCFDFGLATNSWTSTLASFAGTWNVLYGPRFFTTDFGTTGARSEIGFLPDWMMACIISPSIENFDMMTDMGETGLGIPMYCYDRSTSSPVMCINSRLNRWFDGRDGGWLPAPEWTGRPWTAGSAVQQFEARSYDGRVYMAGSAGTTGATPPTHASGSASDGSITWTYLSFDSGWGLGDASHKGNNCFAPFLFTGRRVFMDGQMCEAAYGVYSAGPAYRESGGTVLSGNSCNILQGAQARTQAWALRDAVFGFFVCPTAGPFASGASAFRTYLSDVITGSFTKANNRRTTNISHWGDYAGFLEATYDTDQSVFTPWQNDYAMMGIVRAYLLGFDVAGELLVYMANGYMGNRCRDNGVGWHPSMGCIYNSPRYKVSNNDYVLGFAGAKAEAQYRLSTGYPSGQDQSNWAHVNPYNYTSLAAMSFVDLMQIFPFRAHLATQFDTLKNSGTTYMSTAIMRANPKESVMPRGQTRGP